MPFLLELIIFDLIFQLKISTFALLPIPINIPDPLFSINLFEIIDG